MYTSLKEMIEMNNMNQMMKQVKKMQEQMLKAQEELGGKVIEGSSGGGVVTVEVSGHKKVLSITIKPEAVDPDDVEMLQDLVLTAVNDALSKADELANDDMGKFTGGMKIPGLF
jgi:DNA-binding YbaB/EbfC family protein